MPETAHFINHGFGWVCKRCRAEHDAADTGAEKSGRARFFSEGEAEERAPRLSSPARARWRDETKRALHCPRCGAEEALAETAST